MRWLYSLGIRCMHAGISLSALAGNKKNRQWVDGRRNWRQEYRQRFIPKGKVCWMHVASLGEFEQGRPLLELFRQQHPDWQIVLSFFSPSGYELRKNYALADLVVYLPLDTPANARDFLEIIQPNLVVFVKYDFWAHYLLAIKKRGIPLFLIAAVFRSNQLFFKWYGGLWRKMLDCFSVVFTQDEKSVDLLKSIHYQNVIACGDPRVDRVLQLSATAAPNEIVAAFSSGAEVLVAGSTWPKDEDMLLETLVIPALTHIKIIIAPHDPAPAAVARLIQLLGDGAVRYSEANINTVSGKRWLIIDNVGMLNTLYRYGKWAWIGGGFGVGIHNTLEPAAYGLPVFF